MIIFTIKFALQLENNYIIVYDFRFRNSKFDFDIYAGEIFFFPGGRIVYIMIIMCFVKRK